MGVQKNRSQARCRPGQEGRGTWCSLPNLWPSRCRFSPCVGLAFCSWRAQTPPKTRSSSCARLAPTSLDPSAATLNHRLCCSWRTVPSMPCTRVHAAHQPAATSLVAFLGGALVFRVPPLSPFVCARQTPAFELTPPTPPDPHTRANVQAKAQPAGDKAKTAPAAGSECFPLFVIQSLPFCSSFVQVAHPTVDRNRAAVPFVARMS
jgi:hypothetical protein